MITVNDTITPASMPRFSDLALGEPLQRALQEKNYTVPSPIQAQAIPHLLEGRDLIGIAQTGTGKTAAFALPILHRFTTHPRRVAPKRPRALILAPTRELAIQIGQSFAAYGKHLKLSHLTVFGGVNINPQIHALQRGVDILIATPGRLMDLASQRCVSFEDVEVFVLDEADRMLDMGFINDVRKIVSRLPSQRQSLLFSATMPPAIQELAASMVRNPQRVEVTPAATTVERIEQQVCHIEHGQKRAALAHFIQDHPEGLVLVFVRMKHMANKLVEQLARDGIRAEAIHGNKSQAARQRALENFRTGRSRVLVATDIAARGIDVKGITLVLQHDLPEEPESYVHRIGRTARAGKDGKAIALCGPDERHLLRDVQRIIRQTVPVLEGLPFCSVVSAETLQRDSSPRSGSQGGGRFGFRPARRGNQPPAHGRSGSRFGRGGIDRR